MFSQAELDPLVAEVGALIDAYAGRADPRLMMLPEDGSGRGIPRPMCDGPVDKDGWGPWKVLPSDVTATQIAAVEDQFGVRFPPIWTAYLCARCHLFNQLQSNRYDRQLVWFTDTPYGRNLVPQTRLLETNAPLHRAGFVSIAQWGDGWGPVCFDLTRRRDDGDAPVVWLDHEMLAGLASGGKLGDRTAVEPLAKPLYDTVHEMLWDLFKSP